MENALATGTIDPFCVFGMAFPKNDRQNAENLEKTREKRGNFEF